MLREAHSAGGIWLLAQPRSGASVRCCAHFIRKIISEGNILPGILCSGAAARSAQRNMAADAAALRRECAPSAHFFNGKWFGREE